MADPSDTTIPRSPVTAGVRGEQPAPVTPAEPPTAPRRPRAVRIHGEELVDPYHWLRERDDPEVRAYLEAENAYTRARTEPTRELREELYRELLSHVEEADRTVPYRHGDHLYYRRTEPGREYPVYCRRHAPRSGWAGEAGGARPHRIGEPPAGPEEVLLDLDALAEGHAFLRLGAFAPTPSATAGGRGRPGRDLLAYAIDTTGRERFAIHLLDLATGEHLPDRLPPASCSIAWADESTLFYVVLDASERPYEVRRHALGTDPAGDPVVFREDDARFAVTLRLARSGEVVLITSRSTTASEVRFVSTSDPAAEPRVFQARREGLDYDLAHHPDAFFVRTDEGAPEFRLYRVPIDPGLRPAERGRWQEVLPPRDRVKVEWVQVFRRHLVAAERTAGVRRLRVLPIDAAGESDGAFFTIPMPEPVYALLPAENLDFDADAFRFGFSSPVTPPSVYDFGFDDRRLHLKKRQHVPGYDPKRYRSERIFARAEDGQAIAVTVVYRRDLARDGSHPCYLYGYGSYGTTIEPSFSADRLPLLDRGFVWAIAHVRGGGVFGESWHEGGRLGTKPNTFRDFVAAAEHLVDLGYTAHDRLAIAGGSAGGLLIGAVINQRPDLARAAIAQVPFVDTLNTMLDRSLPLTVTELEEWGDPLEPHHFEVIRSYSPYDNVKPQAYPHLLVTAGFHDPRVQYWEPAKWVAKLRATKTDDHLLLLQTHMHAGHSGASGRYETMRQTAFEQAFVLDALGLA